MKLKSGALAATALVQIICAAPNKHFLRNDGRLTESTTENAGVVGTRFLRNAAGFYGVPESDLSSLYLAREFKTDHNGVTHLRYRQRYDGIDVAGSDFTVNLDSDGRILNAGGAMFGRPNIQTPLPRDAMLGPCMRIAMNSVDPSTAHDIRRWRSRAQES
jgi:Zn-dependent metalloprotease